MLRRVLKSNNVEFDDDDEDKLASSGGTFAYTSRPLVLVPVVLRALTSQTGWCSSLRKLNR